MKRTPADPELLKDRLAPLQGKQYWRAVEELADDPASREMLEREFPDHASSFTDPVSRRRFLMLMGASLALAGASGCRPPTGKIVPFIRQPEGVIPGRPLFYATTMPLAGWGTGLLAVSHEGRPTKVEGNEKHPSSRGGTSAIHQAAILGLYDPYRSQTAKLRGQPRPLGDVLGDLRKRLAAGKGKGFALLTGLVGSPTLHALIQGFLKGYPEARHFQHEPVHRDNAIVGARLAFARDTHVVHHVEKADIVVSLDANFLAEGPAHLADARAFATRRKPEGMNRLYVLETDLTVTGATADNRLALKPSRIEAFARGLAERLELKDARPPKLSPEEARWADVIAADLKNAGKGKSLVIAGDGQPPAVHALAHAMNASLGSHGATVSLLEPPLPARTEAGTGLKAFREALEAGELDTLLIVDCNPAYTAPADLPIARLLEAALKKPKWLAVHLGQAFDETARLCHWHIPQTHFLEQWGDAVGHDGTASIIQPLIAPLYESKSAIEVLAGLTRVPESDTYDTRTPLDILKAHWRPKATGDFDAWWQTVLHDGVIAGTEGKHVPSPIDPALFHKKEMQPREASESKGLELRLAAEPGVFDGQFANNGWLQEWPRPITRLTWDNALLVSPRTAAELKLNSGTANGRGGEHGNAYGDVVSVTHGRYSLDVPVWVVPGHADGAATLYLGYGRTRAGKVGTGAGFDAYKLRLSISQWAVSGVQVNRKGRRHPLACVQGHSSMEGRDLVRSATLTQWRHDPNFATKPDEHRPGFVDAGGGRRKPLTLYPPQHEYTGYRWGMAVDLSSCTGCGACVVACHAENNSPIVGKEEVMRGREMHWLRIDRYFQTGREKKPLAEMEHPNVYFQPVMCQHCEQAPCELVCPVEATAHGDEGTNDMAYNRCVGTRYCANNCPYKVRRFNFLQYADFDTPSFKLMYNPEVTVRSRGVMEKCTFCIQRVSAARIVAATEAMDELDLPAALQKRRDDNGPGGQPRRHDGKEVPLIRDGEVLTACQSACPSSAIVFGDLNDRKSQVRRMHESALRYDLLGELGTRPRVAYLASVRNPSPDLPSEGGEHGH
jgi:molybdopterin-containing oxidoreductase family iron-sulfur binding subunit